MALIATNQTGSPVVLAAGNPAPTVPANSAMNVTSELAGLSGGNYVSLQAQTPASIVYSWSTGVAEYATSGLTIGTAQPAASGSVAGVITTAAQTIAGAKTFSNGILTNLINSNGASSITMQGGPVDASNAVGNILGSSTTLSTAGAMLTVVKNNTSTVVTVDPNGIINAVPTGLTTPASGTGITVNYNGDHRRGCFKITIAYTAWTAAAVTQDITLAVIPAKCRIVSVIADTTAALTLGAATLNLVVGKTGTLAGFIASHDVKTSTVTKGLADADMGTLLTRAAAIQGGHLASFTTTTNLTCSLTSGSTNLGSAGVTSLTTGSTTFYVIAEMM